jgi:hypothetical protein
MFSVHKVLSAFDVRDENFLADVQAFTPGLRSEDLGLHRANFQRTGKPSGRQSNAFPFLLTPGIPKLLLPTFSFFPPAFQTNLLSLAW